MRQLNTFKRRMLLLLAALFSLGYAYAQIDVSGKLTGPDGQGLIGATITEKGTKNATMVLSDDGSWSLRVQGAESVLVFELATYATETRTVGSNRNFTVRMRPDAGILDVKVVKIGYASARPEDVTGGITQLTGSEVSKAPVLAVDQALQGKAAGVQVRANSGSPGSGMDIVIRGRGTTGDARPLYVVNGVPSGNEYRGDPSNIESISILKDASSCAIYGARGANGVVLITTRGGNEVSGAGSDYINVSFDASMGVQQAWRKLDLLSGDEYAALYPDYSQPYIDQYGKVYNTDWQDEVLQKGLTNKFKITLDGASAKSSWTAGASSTKQEGIVRGSGYQRYDVGYKGMWQLSKHIDLGANIGFSQSTQDRIFEGNMERSILGNALIAPPITPVSDASLVTEDNPYGFASTAKYFNPVGLIEYGDASTPNSTIKNQGLGAGTWLTIKPIKNLEFTSRASYASWGNNEEIYVRKFFISSTTNQQNPKSFLQNNLQDGYNWSVSNTLSYNLNLKDKLDSTRIKHAIRLIAGHEALYEYQSAYRVKINDVPEAEDLRYPSKGDPTAVEYWVEDYEYPFEHTMLSYFGRAEYGFMDRYLINGTLRRDGSSRFGDANKFGWFPSVGFAWKVNKEPFFYNNEWLKNNVSMFKIRGGWGKIGNSLIKNYLFVSTYDKDVYSGYSFGGNQPRENGATPKTASNPGIMWEEATSWNIGTNINLFKNKIMFSYDYFTKTNYNNLIPMSVPAVVGIDNGSGPKNPTVNAGTIRNKGSEFELTYRNNFKLADSAKHAVNYDISANFTINDNKVTGMEGAELPGGFFDRQNTFVANTKEGYPVAAFFGYKVDGIFQNWEEVNKGAQPDAQPGDYRIVDINGDGKIDDADVTYIGNPHPKFSYGLTFNAGYAGFDLGIAIQGVAGVDLFNYTKYFLDGGYEMSNMSARRLDAWSSENTGSSEPTNTGWFAQTGPGKGIFPHSGFIENGRYIRLKNVTLGYTLPERISKKFYMQKLRVYVQGQNLITLTPYSGYDPEIGTNTGENWRGPEFGIDRGVYPQARAFVGGLNITF